MKRRSKYSTSGVGRDGDRKRPEQQQPAPQFDLPTPFAGKPLDGSQYIDVIEEQKYAEQRPSPEQQRPRKAGPDRSR